MSEHDVTTVDRLMDAYSEVGWPATWDVRATIALADDVRAIVAGFPWGKFPEITGVNWDGEIILVYTDQKPSTTAEEIIDNIGICLRVPMQSALG